MTRRPNSIRRRLRVATLLPLLAAIGACWLIGLGLIADRLTAAAQRRVDGDLAAARQILHHELGRLGEIVTLAALDPALVAALDAGAGVGARAAVLRQVAHNERLTLFNAVDRFGLVLFRAASDRGGERLGADPLLRRALAGATGSGIVLLDPERLAREHPALPARARIAVRDTPQARPYAKGVEERGLFLMATAPVRRDDGRVVGALQAGILLNGDDALIDDLTRILYGDEPGGVATLFLDDVRIATSVRAGDGQRAVGSRLSATVAEQVLERGQPWHDRAFVVDDWYVSAYEPLRDPAGRVVGALYVGLPEAPLKRLRLGVHLLFAAVLVVGGSLGLGLSEWLGARLARPVRALAESARRLGAGERVAPLASGGDDEIGQLAAEFDRMAQRLQERETEIGALNRSLEAKVAARGAELAQQGERLLATQRELARAERLAGIGLLAAGVAHEINNPLAIIRGNAELLQGTLPASAEQQEEVTIILQQAARIERIVANLRSFSRREQKSPAPLALSPLLDTICAQIGHQHPHPRVTIERRDRAAALELVADADQLRQVFTNLILNALQAMPDGGTLTIAAERSAAGDRAVIRILDRGPGLAADARERLFTPFYTTKSHGTGLGLAVSYGIVQDHGGTLDGANRQGGGAVFTVTLPLRP